MRLKKPYKTNMNKYECSKCKREVVVHSPKDSIEITCCSGDTPVKFSKVGTKVVVAVKELPKAMTDKTPLPPSTPSK
jgi:hypothetical protein